MVTYLISDTHWYHDKLIEKYRPPNFTELIIENWKRIVKENDIIIHLGDVIFYKHTILNELLNSLPGYKVLIKGNHDKKGDLWFLKRGFSEVYKTLKIDNILFSHAPTKTEFLNIHGHLHTSLDTFIKKDLNMNRLFSLEIEDYKPVELNEFIKRSNSTVYYKYGINDHHNKYGKDSIYEDVNSSK